MYSEQIYLSHVKPAHATIAASVEFNETELLENYFNFLKYKGHARRRPSISAALEQKTFDDHEEES